jgi:hypothetical protein
VTGSFWRFSRQRRQFAIDTSHALDPANACRQLRTEETGIGRLICDPSDGSEPEIDRGGRVVVLLEMDAIAEHDRAVERQPRLRTVPGDELGDRVVVGTLAAR